MRWYQAAMIFALAAILVASAPAYGPELEGFEYAFPVQRFDFESQRQKLHMSYLELRPQTANGHTALLLHGKNFCAGTWEATIRALSAAGYRVIAPDQVGFCKSSKPERYQYSFHQLAPNPRALLEKLGAGRVTLIAHSPRG